MAPRVSRVVVNRQALTALQGAFADGMAAVGKAVIENARPPDAEPFGEGLVTTGAWGVWAGGKKVAGTAEKPRRVRISQTGITLLAGYDFPGRFQETGTVRHPPQPFVTPTMMETMPDAGSYIKPVVQKVTRRG